MSRATKKVLWVMSGEEMKTFKGIESLSQTMII